MTGVPVGAIVFASLGVGCLIGLIIAFVIALILEPRQ